MDLNITLYNLLYKKLKSNWFILFLSSIYAILINIYFIPSDFDINRYIKIFQKFQNYSQFDEIKHIFSKTPDFLFYVYEFICVKLNVNLEILFFVFSYITVFVCLFTFKKYYFYYQRNYPKNWQYFYVWLFIPVAAVLSGIRNIHSFSFVLLAFYYLKIHKNKHALIILAYASFIHYSSYVFFIFFFLYQLLDIKKNQVRLLIIIVFFAIGQFLVIENLLQFLEVSKIDINGIFYKLNFYYLKHNDLKIALSNKYSFLSFLFSFFTNYWLLFLAFFDLKALNKKVLNKELIIFLSLFLFFVFFPTIANRYLFLFNLIFVFKILIQNDSKKIFYVILVLGSLASQFYFWVIILINKYLDLKIMIRDFLFNSF